MRDPAQGGAFSCDSALALDGGGSTQLWVAGREDLAIAGETRVHNALIVQRK
jgi:exopolysaccharide biosynthesis protein